MQTRLLSPAAPAGPTTPKTGAQIIVDAFLAQGAGPPCVVDFPVKAGESVWPMVPAGKALHEMEGLQALQNAM